MPKIIWFSYITLLLLGWLDNIRSPFFPDVINSLTLDPIQGALFFAVTSLLSFMTSLSGAFWLKRFSSLHILQAAILGLGLTFLLVARAPNLPILLSAAALFGISYGFLNFAQNIVIQENAPPALRRRIFAGLHSMYGVAALLAPLSATMFMSVGMNWRMAFSILGLLPIVAWVASLKVFEAQAPPPRQADSTMMPAFSKRALWVAGLSIAFYMFGEIAVATRLVLWLRTEFGVDPETANNYLATFFCLLLAGRLIFTFMDFTKFSNRTVLAISASSSCVLLVLALVHDPIWMALSGATMSPFYPVGMNHLSELYGAHAARALAFGIGLCSMTTVILHFTLGVLTDIFGLGQALWLSPIGLVIVVILLYLQPPVLRRGNA